MKTISKTLLFALLVCPIALHALDTEHITKGLTSEDYDLRQETLNQLNSEAAQASKPGAAADIRKAMETALLEQVSNIDLDDETRVYYLRALQKVISEDGLLTLFKLIEDSANSDWIIEECFACMSKLQTPEGLELILTAMQDATDEQIDNYWSVLARLRNPQSNSTLLKLLKKDKLELTDTALLSLSKYADKEMVEYLYDEWKDADDDNEDSRELIAQAILVTEQAGAKQLNKLLNSSLPSNLVTSAFKQLMRIDSEDALDFLSTMISEFPDQSTPLIRATADVGTDSVWATLLKMADKLSPANLAALLAAAEEHSRTEFEALAIQQLDAEELTLQIAAIDCLRVIGTESSSDALLQKLKSKEKDIVEATTLALTELNDANLDATMLAMVEAMTPSAADAITVLAIRNSPGSLELLNDIVLTETPEEITKPLLDALVDIGDVSTCKRLMTLILNADSSSNARPYQLALKRLTVRLEQPENLWSECYQPALKLAFSDELISRIVVILDAVPTDDVLDYCIALKEGDSELLSESAMQPLVRWQTLDVCDYWMQTYLQKDDVSEAEQKRAIGYITSTLGADSTRTGAEERAAKGVELFTKTENRQLREAIIKTFAKLDEWPRSSFKRRIEPFLSIADYKDKIEALNAE